MTKFFANTTLATLTVAAGFMAFTSFSAQASVTSKLQNCRYDSREKVISCCEKVVRLGVKPFWMVQSGGSCSSVAVCKGSKRSGRRISIAAVVAPPKPKCFIAMTPNDVIRGSGTNVPQTPDTPRGNFNPTRG